MCEWCGREHARDALCASRPKWSRRGFLALFGAGLAGAVVAAKIPFTEFGVNAGGAAGTYGGIVRSTYAFWRNQQADGVAGALSAEKFKAALNDVFVNRVFGPLPDLIITDPATLRRYEKLLT